MSAPCCLLLLAYSEGNNRSAVIDDVSFYTLQRRAVNLSAEVDEGIKKWKAEKEEQERAREQLKSSMLKPKGKMLLKKKSK